MVQAVVAALFAQAPTRGVELHLAVGEALACAGAGWACTVLDDWRRRPVGAAAPAEDGMDQDDGAKRLKTDDRDAEPEAFAMDAVLEPILATYGPSPEPAVRQAMVLWILALLRHTGRTAPVKVSGPPVGGGAPWKRGAGWGALEAGRGGLGTYMSRPFSRAG